MGRPNRGDICCRESYRPAEVVLSPIVILDGGGLLTVQTVCSPLVLTLIILVPARPSRENVTSMPSVRRNVCARRSRPASARGVFGQPALLLQSSSPAKSAARKRSAALPVHALCLAKSPRTHVATGSASIMP